MSDRPLCDSRFCNSLATWHHRGPNEAYACDEHVPPDHAGWEQPLGWLSEIAFDPEKLQMQHHDDELYQRLANSMTNHTPSPEQVERIEALRDAGKVLAWDIANSCPLSRERSIAATHLEDCIMWAVKSIVLEQ